MSKKFKNIENDESFKNFKLEDYMPSMPEHKQEDSFSLYWMSRTHPQNR